MPLPSQAWHYGNGAAKNPLIQLPSSCISMQVIPYINPKPELHGAHLGNSSILRESHGECCGVAGHQRTCNTTLPCPLACTHNTTPFCAVHEDGRLRKPSSYSTSLMNKGILCLQRKGCYHNTGRPETVLFDE